jgi:hypothetical protein
MEGSRMGASLFVGAPLAGSLLGIQKDIGRRDQRMDMSVHWELGEIVETGLCRQGISLYASSV